MLEFLRGGGSFVYPMLLLALVVAVLTVRGARRLFGAATAPGPRAEAELHAILFWGVICAILGYLGQAVGIYNALLAISRARELSPSVIAQGYAQSFTTVILGLVVLVGAAIAWFVLHARLRRIAAAALLLAGLLAGSPDTVLASGGPTAATATEQATALAGFWQLDIDADVFVFVITPAAGGHAGLIHCLRDGVKVSELPISAVAWDPPRVELHMAATGVRFAGELQAGGRRIAGRLLYGDGTERPCELARVARSAHAALQSRATRAYAYAPPPERDDGWPVAGAGRVDLDAAGLARMVEHVAGGDYGLLHAVLVARHGTLVLEEYFHGYDRDTLHPLASCTKSVASLLVGLARDRGLIPDLDAAVAGYFPDRAAGTSPAWRSITLRHVLTMSAGLGWSEEELRGFHDEPDYFGAVLARPAVHPPGSRWRYASPEVNLIARVLREATGRHADAFAAEALFRPLGIASWNWDHLKRDGYPLLDGSLQLRPRDMAKLGQLVLDGGAWRGRRVISEAWIRESTSPQIETGEPEGYGYLWWIRPAPAGGGAPGAIFANGWGSQFVFVLPELDLVVVTTGGNQDNGQHFAPGRMILQDLLPAVRAGGS